MLFGEGNGDDGHSTTTVLLTAIGGLFTAAITALTTAWAMLAKQRADGRKAAAEARKVEVDADREESRHSTTEARARQKIKQEDEAWAVGQARELYEQLRDRMDVLVAQERECQIRLATIETQYADLKLAHEETKARLVRLEGGHGP